MQVRCQHVYRCLNKCFDSLALPKKKAAVIVGAHPEEGSDSEVETH